MDCPSVTSPSCKIALLRQKPMCIRIPLMGSSALSIVLFLVLWTAAGSAAISVHTGPKPDETVAGKILVRTLKLKRYLTELKPDQIVENKDSHGGDKPDIFIVYDVNEKGAKQLDMQLFDYKRNGNISLVKHFQKNKIVKEERADDDGVTTSITEFNPENGAIKKKSQSDGHTNMWTYYAKNEIYRKEVDRNSDGKPDMWVYYRHGKVYRTEIDENFDGKKIVRIEAPMEHPSKVTE
jgi:hypothetical protein